MKHNTILIACLFYVCSGIIGIILGQLLIDYINKNKFESTIIELPEEYKLINKNDTLRGYFDKDSVLHIEFNNYRNRK